MKTLPMIKNMTIIAFAQTEIQSSGPCGIVLVKKPDGEFVTAWYRLGDNEWVWGHYFMADNEIGAYTDFLERVREYKRIPKPEPVKAKRRKAATI
jgi:hypothetical protein